MNKLLTFFLFCALSWPVFGQIGGVNVQGNVTSADGMPVSNIPVFIINQGADSSFVFGTVETDQNGQFEYMFDVPSNDLTGVVTVTIPDCNGNILESSQTWIGVAGDIVDLQFDFIYCENIFIDSCYVFVVEELDPAGNVILSAITPIFPPINDVVEYTWSTGETGPSIVPQDDGIYCVFASFPDSCVAETCYEYVQDTFNDQCWAYIDVIYNDFDSTTGSPITATLIANIEGTAPFTYSWDQGATTHSIDVGPGTYCVEITDANGCMATACVDVLDFSFCEVFIGCDPPGSFQAQAFGVPPFQYIWSTGDTSMALYPNEPGEYCVTVTDAVGCEVSTCAIFDTFPPIDDCFTFIVPNFDTLTGSGNPTDTGVILTALTFGVGPFEYIWNTGELTESITVADLTQIYCVTVTDATGCVSTACTDIWNDFCWSWIEVVYLDDSTAQLDAFTDSQFGVVDWQWSNGESGQSITVSESGSYCVTVMDDLGCVSEACVWVDFQPDTFGCFVILFPHFDSVTNGTTLVEAFAFGAEPLTYVWSNGDTGPISQITNPNEQLCVTVTDANGCVATGCLNDFFDPCSVFIEGYPSSTDSTFTLEAYSAFGTATGGIYAWSTGETTSSITVTESGEYCVVASFPNGCVDTACFVVDFLPIDPTQTYLSGFVLGGGSDSTLISATVYAYHIAEIDSANNDPIYELVDSTFTNDIGYYEFADLPLGVYVVKAVAENNPNNDVDYFPTYHYDAITWENAIPVVNLLFSDAFLTTNILMQPTNPNGGGGLIGGSLIDPNGLMNELGNVLRDAGVAGVQILLEHQVAGQYRYTTTDENGDFRFDNLPWGTYKLYFDFPGLASPEVWVTIGPNNAESTGVVINTSGTTVSTIDPTLAESITLSPNPTADLVEIQIADIEGEIEVALYSLNGQRLFENAMNISRNERISVDLNNYSPGPYLIEISTNQGYATKMIMKQ